MKNSKVLLLSFGSQVMAGNWKIQKRDLIVTQTVFTTTTFCPCSTSTPPPSSTISFPSISTFLPGSVGSPILTFASTTSNVPSISTIPASYLSSTTTVSLIPSTSISSVGPPGSTVFVSAATLPDYQTTVLQQHNIHRLNHTAAPLTWSNIMAQYASQIAATCVYGHSRAAGDGNYGQNIGAGFTPGQIAFMLTNAMYNGEMTKFPGPYGSDNVDESSFLAWGHFSQIVWADTQQVGCATQYCPGGLANAGGNTPPYFTVCNYFPSGNFQGQWSKVHAPIGNPSVVIVN